MKREEIEEICKLLSGSGLNPRLCDEPVPYIDSGVRAGLPTEPGDMVQGKYILLPREVLGMHPMFIIDVIGDSMRDAGILPGDRLQIEICAPIHDGDVIVASIDGECTVKAYCTDDRGQQWLVPRNEAYDAILITEEMNVSLIGRVVGQMKDAPRTSYSDLMRTIRRTRGKNRTEHPVENSRVEAALLSIAPAIEHGRQWYAVYRALVDRRALEEGDFSGFVALVSRLVPQHGHLPVTKELGRMAVQSFRKPVVLWESGDAPVSGQRFHDYLRIARLTADALG